MRIFLLVGLMATAALAEAPLPAPAANAPRAEVKAAPAGETKAPAEAKPAAAPAEAPKADSDAAKAAAPVAEAKPEAAPAAEPKPDAPRLDPSLPGAAKADAPAEDLDFGWMLLRTLVVLGLVIMLAWLSLNYGLRKLMGVRAPVPGASVVQVLERVPLDNKHGMFVVKAAGEYLLIGGGEGNLSLIAKLNAEEVEKLRAQTKAPMLAMSPLLQKLLSRRDAPPPTPGSNG